VRRRRLSAVKSAGGLCASLVAAAAFGRPAASSGEMARGTSKRYCSLTCLATRGGGISKLFPLRGSAPFRLAVISATTNSVLRHAAGGCARAWRTAARMLRRLRGGAARRRLCLGSALAARGCLVARCCLKKLWRSSLGVAAGYRHSIVIDRYRLFAQRSSRGSCGGLACFGGVCAANNGVLNIFCRARACGVASRWRHRPVAAGSSAWLAWLSSRRSRRRFA